MTRPLTIVTGCLALMACGSAGSTADLPDAVPGTEVGADAGTDGPFPDLALQEPGPSDPGTPDPGSSDAARSDPGSPDPGSPDPDAGDPGAFDPGTDAAVDPGPADLPAGPALVLSRPADGDRAVVGHAVPFSGQVACQNATVTFTADGRYPFGTLTGVQGAFEHAYAFSSPGVDRRITVAVTGDGGCAGSVDVKLTVQPAFAVTVEERTDGNGNPFQARIARFPTADPTANLVVAGGDSAHAVRWFAESAGIGGAAAAVNGGYFAAGSGPVSYAKGSAGYESPSGNVKGPRTCLVWDGNARTARVALSMGRAWADGAWGPGLFPGDTDVACGGPRLLQDGLDVFWAHYASENFEASGISPSSPLPRTAACVTLDGSVLLVAAQSSTVKARGFTLPELVAWLKSLGCVDAVNLDGGGSTAFWSPYGYWPGTEDRAVYHAVMVVRD